MISTAVAYLNKIRAYRSFVLGGILIAVLMIIIHIIIKPYGDDLFFMSYPYHFSNELISWLTHRYYIWSSRILIEAVLWVIARNFLLWKILNIIVILVLYLFTAKLIINKDSDKKMYLVVALCIICYPFFHLGTAGYMTTSVFYLWPLTAAVVACYGMYKSLLKRKIHFWEYIVYSLLFIFASNMEPFTILLLAITIVFLAFSFYRKDINIFLIIQLFFAVLMLIFIFTCPGNTLRMISEIGTWYPGFESLSFVEKFQLGYTSTLAHLFATPNTVFPLFAVILCILVYCKYSNLRYRVIATVPIIIYLVSISVVIFQMSIFDNWTISRENVIEWAESIRYVQSGVVLLTQDNYTNLSSYIPIISFTVCALCVLYSLYYAVDKSEHEQHTLSKQASKQASLTSLCY